MSQEFSAVDRIIEATRTKRTVLCAGFDPRLEWTPRGILDWALKEFGRTYEAAGRAILQYNLLVLSATAPFVAAVKLQIGFYEPYGHWGIWAYEQTLACARQLGLVAIADVKRGDGEDTAQSYARTYLGVVPFWGDGGEQFTAVESPLRADLLTIHPNVGSAGILPFVTEIKDGGGGAFVVTKTSYRPNSEVEQLATTLGIPVWQAVAHMVDDWGKGTEGKRGYRNLGVVMGATYPEDAVVMRQILPVSYFLIPGYGGQGAPADAAVMGFNEDGLGGLVNSSSALQYAYRYRDPRFQGPPERASELAAKAAEAARDDLNEALTRAGKLNW